MPDQFTDIGLADRTRVMVHDTDADYIPKLQVDELILGGVSIYAGQGTRYANGRLYLKGRDDNNLEIAAVPGDACQSKGIMTQIMFFSKAAVKSFKRFAINIMFDGEGEYVKVDSSAHENTYAMPVYMPAVGAKSRDDGTDVPNTEHLSFSYFQDGSHEMHLNNDTLRVELSSFALAFMANDRTLIKARELVNGVWQPKVFTNG